MDYWQSVELSSNRIRQFVDNLHLLRDILNDKEKRFLFFNRFPCDQLLSISTLNNHCDVLLCAQLLDFFMSYEDFNTSARLSYVLEFILGNLNHIQVICEGVNVLLDLLFQILQRNPAILENSFKNIFDKERILEVLLKISKLNSIDDDCLLLVLNVFKQVIESSIPETAKLSVKQLFQELQKYVAVYEQIYLCHMILNSSQFWCEHFEEIYQWLIESGTNLISITTSTNLMKNTIECILIFIRHWTTNHRDKDEYSYSKYWLFTNKLYNNLVKKINVICIHASNTIIKANCISLLQFLVLKFLNDEKLSSTVQDQTLTEIELFSEDVELWPRAGHDIFFCICQISMEYSSIIWKESDVLKAIMKCFYNRRDLIKTFILKSIYYIYPKLIYKKYKPETVFQILGEDLLHYFTKVCYVPYLYSFNCEQLTWMLRQASHSVKLCVLTEWLLAAERNEALEPILISTIKQCKAEVVLLHLIIKSDNMNPRIASRSAMLLNRLPNDKISYLATAILPFALEKPVSLYYFLVASPNLNLGPSESLLMSSLMGAVLPSLSDIQILRSASIFTAKLLAYNKSNPNIIKGFCRNINNLKYFIAILEKVDDETATEQLKLLKILTLVQHLNKINFGTRLKCHFKLCLTGSPDKIKSCLKLLFHVLVFKFSIIDIDMKDILEIYGLVLDYSFNQFLHNSACQCIIAFIKRIPWLGQTINTSVFLEMVCFSDNHLKGNIFKILEAYLMLIRRTPYNGFSPIPLMSIRSFVLRGDLPERKVNEYLAILQQLEKKEENLLGCKFAFRY